MNQDLIQYIEKDVFPLYERNEEGHGKVYLEDKEFDESLKNLREALSNKDEFINRVKRVTMENKY